MTEDTFQAVVERCKKLWAKADDPACTPAEAKAFRDKAAEQMSKYGIDQITLDVGSSANGEAPIVFGQFRVHDFKEFLVPDARIALMGAIGRNFECKGVIHHREYPSADKQTGEPMQPGVYYECIGYQHDYEMVKQLYYNLVVDMIAGVLSEKQKDKNYGNQFAEGYVERIDDRLKEMLGRVHDYASTHSDSTAIAIMSRKERVVAKFNEMYPPDSLTGFRRMERSGRYDPNARARGAARANNADLTGGRGGIGKGSVSQIGDARKGLKRGES
jgi:Protein of unknown function (DUF2786)